MDLEGASKPRQLLLLIQPQPFQQRLPHLALVVDVLGELGRRVAARGVVDALDLLADRRKRDDLGRVAPDLSTTALGVADATNRPV